MTFIITFVSKIKNEVKILTRFLFDMCEEFCQIQHSFVYFNMSFCVNLPYCEIFVSKSYKNDIVVTSISTTSGSRVENVA